MIRPAPSPKRKPNRLVAVTLDENSIGRSNPDVEHERAIAIYDLFLLSLSPLRRLVKDYYTVCDSYYEAIRTATPDRIEALDMGRRALHDEGCRILMERLARKVKLDFDTGRRLFTLICVLHWKG
jgi:uncharacterized protein (UPF0262 family)